jgi:FKBP-type peptidyl-prolyl cis-trans isomerase FkpA
MKYNNGLLLLLAIFIIAGCGKLDYKKTKTGLLYKIISTKDTKGPLVKNGNVMKFFFIQKLNDSVLQTNYGKMPRYQRIGPNGIDYDPSEVFTMLHKGDSLISVMLVDSLILKGIVQTLPPFMKRGDRMTVIFKVVDLFPSDSLARNDYNAEVMKDKPRQQKEMQQQMEAQKKLMMEQRQKDEEEWRKSGEIDKELKDMKNYLASKKITPQQTGKGTFVVIKQQGTGASLNDGDTVTVKYTGRILATDSVFQSNTYSFPLGEGQVIEGWDEGLKLFKTGGKGTLYVPGFLAYGKNASPPFKSFEALTFDVEVLNSKPGSASNK